MPPEVLFIGLIVGIALAILYGVIKFSVHKTSSKTIDIGESPRGDVNRSAPTTTVSPGGRHEISLLHSNRQISIHPQRSQTLSSDGSMSISPPGFDTAISMPSPFLYSIEEKDQLPSYDEVINSNQPEL